MGKRRFVSADDWLVWDMLRSPDDVDHAEWDGERATLPYVNKDGLREWPVEFGGSDYLLGETQAQSLKGRKEVTNAK